MPPYMISVQYVWMKNGVIVFLRQNDGSLIIKVDNENINNLRNDHRMNIQHSHSQVIDGGATWQLYLLTSDMNTI